MNRLKLSGFLAASLLVVAPLPAPALSAAPVGQSAAQAAQDVFDLDFAGGTIADYVKAILRVQKNANIVVMPEAASVTMPAMQLRGVDLDAAANLLDGRRVITGHTNVVTSVRTVGSSRQPSPGIYTISAKTDLQPAQTQIHSVVDLLEGGLSSDDMMTAIETTLALIGDIQPTAQIRFHPQTGILIVRGHPEQVQAVNEVIGQLYDGVQRQRRKADEKVRLDRARVQADAATAQVGQLKAELSAASISISEHQARSSILQQEIERLLRRVDTLEQERLVLTERLNAAMIHFETLKKERGAGGDGG